VREVTNHPKKHIWISETFYALPNAI